MTKVTRRVSLLIALLLAITPIFGAAMADEQTYSIGIIQLI